MSGIEELRQRVMDAETRFGLNDVQRAKYSERLIVLMNAVEGRIREQQDQIDQHAAAIEKHTTDAAARQAKIDGQGTAIAQQAEEIEKHKAAEARKAEENEQLRTMLHALLRAIESGGGDGLAEAMQELDRKASMLVSTVATEPVAEEIEEPVAEVETEAPVAEEAAEPVAEEIEEPVAEVETEAPVAEGAAEPVTAEPVAAELVAEEIEAAVAEAPAEPVAEESEEGAPEAASETDSEVTGGSLDDIMERVSKLVEETEAAIVAPEPGAPEAPAETLAEDLVEEIAEDPAQQATGTDP